MGNGARHEDGGPDRGGGAVEAKDGVIQKSDGGEGAENGEEARGEVAFADDVAPEAEEEEIERGMGRVVHGGPDFGGRWSIGEGGGERWGIDDGVGGDVEMNGAAAGGELGGPEFVEPVVVVGEGVEAQGDGEEKNQEEREMFGEGGQWDSQ